MKNLRPLLFLAAGIAMIITGLNGSRLLIIVGAILIGLAWRDRVMGRGAG